MGMCGRLWEGLVGVTVLGCFLMTNTGFLSLSLSLSVSISLSVPLCLSLSLSVIYPSLKPGLSEGV